MDAALDQHGRKKYGVQDIIDEVGVSRSSYYYTLKKHKRAPSRRRHPDDSELAQLLREVQAERDALLRENMDLRDQLTRSNKIVDTFLQQNS